MISRGLIRRLSFSIALAGLLTTGASLFWVLELLTHFRVQYVVVATVFVILALAKKQMLAAALLVVALAINAWPLLPYLIPTARPGPASDISVLNINVNSDNLQHSDIIGILREREDDIVAILELTPELDESLSELAENYPYSYTLPLHGNFGIGVLSRHPIVAREDLSTGDTDAIDATFALPEGSVRFLAVHLLPPVSTAYARERNRQLQFLARYVSAIDEPLIVCGDLNLTPYSPYFSRFLNESGLRDARRGRGIDISWPTFMPLAGVPIDHCFWRGPLQADSVQRMERIGSDHYPVGVRFSWQTEE